MKLRVKATVIVVAVIVVGGFIAYYSGLFNKFFGTQEELKIDETANVVVSIKKISEFVSMNYYEEFIISSDKASAIVDNSVGQAVAKMFGKNTKALVSDKIVIIARGHIRAGFNLAKVQEEDVKVSGDTLFVTLPKAEILNATINPSDFEVFVEDGDWSHEEIVAIENKAIKELDSRARKAGVLEKAEKNGIEQLTNMYKAFGFKEVICSIK